MRPPTHLEVLDPSVKERLEGVNPSDAELDRPGDLVPGGQVHQPRAAPVQRKPPYVFPLVLS